MQKSYIVIQKLDFIHEYNRVRPCFITLLCCCIHYHLFAYSICVHSYCSHFIFIFKHR